MINQNEDHVKMIDVFAHTLNVLRKSDAISVLRLPQ